MKLVRRLLLGWFEARSGASLAGLATRMAERLKAPVLKPDPAHSGKFLKTNQIPYPANDLRLFSISLIFIAFHCF
jgi:hypothetical protein